MPYQKCSQAHVRILHFFRQEGGIEAAQAARQKWIENEHKKITDSIIGNLLYLIICKNHPSQPLQSSRMVTLLKLINSFTQVQLLLFCTTDIHIL